MQNAVPDCEYVDEYEERRKALKIALKGLYIELSAIPAALLALLCAVASFSTFALFVFIALCLWVFVGPCIGCVWGFVTLFMKYKSRASIAVSLISLLLPVVVVVTIILLFSTGVLVIRFM